MSLTSAMQTANNGLNVHTRAMNTISDNIANVSTPGFKEARVGFQDMVSGAAGTLDAGGSGQGALIGSISQSFTQGSNLGTGVATHLSMSGDGFFIVSGTYSGQNGQYFTRDGTFRTDSSGNLVTTDDLSVQGYKTDLNGKPIGSMSDINLPISQLSPPQKTSKMELGANIDNSGPVQTFSATNPDGTSTYETGVTIFDSLGGEHSMRTYFTKRGPQALGAVTYPNTYDYNIMCNPAELATGQANPVATGTLYFDASGRLQAVNTAAAATATMTVSFNSAVPSQAVAIDFGDPMTVAGGTGITGMTCWDGGNVPQRQSQDGYGMGVLRAVSVTQQGLISGSYSNGPIRPLAQLATGTFTCNDRLERVGHNLFVATFDSGLPIINNSGANMTSGSLEQSNVDLGEQLINAMTNQRGFQANTRTIQTVNDMFGALINLGR